MRFKPISHVEKAEPQGQRANWWLSMDKGRTDLQWENLGWGVMELLYLDVGGGFKTVCICPSLQNQLCIKE